MEKQNIAPFYIGQKVVYITGNNMPKGTIDVVADIKQDLCGCWFISLSKNKSSLVRETNPLASIIQCGTCHKMFGREGWVKLDYYWLASSFRPVQEQTFPLITYEKVMEKEKQLISAN